jgi:hypothetical protein
VTADGPALFGLHAAPRPPGRGTHRRPEGRPSPRPPGSHRAPPRTGLPRPPTGTRRRPPGGRPPGRRFPRLPALRPPSLGRGAARWARRLRDDRRAALVAGGLALVLVAGLAWTLTRGGEKPAAPGRPGLTLQLPLNAAELDGADLDRALDQVTRAGATQVSTGAAWWFLTQDRDPHAYDWRPLDRLVDAAAARGLGVRLQLTGTPDAVHPGLAATVAEQSERVWYPPRTTAELREWGRFVAATVTHFKGRVNAFEIWNEPNIDTFFKPEPDPAGYAKLLAEAYRGAKRAWPDARVLFGGLSQNDVGYLERFYREVRALFPDAPRNRYFFDELNVHPYTDGRSPDQTSGLAVTAGQFGPVDRNFGGLWRMKAVMDEAEGASSGKTILLGEYGFTTAPIPGLPGVTPVPDRRRAYFLKRAVDVAGRMPFVSGLAWYGFWPDSTTAEGWTIARAGAAPTWTYQALADVRAGGGPSVRLPGPSALAPGAGPVRPVLSGLSPRDVTHAELYVDGVLVAEADGPEVRWDGPERPDPGARVQLVLYTRDRHVWPSDAVTLSTPASSDD